MQGMSGKSLELRAIKIMLVRHIDTFPVARPVNTHVFNFAGKNETTKIVFKQGQSKLGSRPAVNYLVDICFKLPTVN